MDLQSGDAMRRMNRNLHDGVRGAGKRRKSIGSAPMGRPKGFTAHRDPNGLFILEYPSDWTLTQGSGVHVISPRSGSFARVDIIPITPQLWENLMTAMSDFGAKATIEKRNEDKPVHVRGKVQTASTKFAWNAYAYEAGEQEIILSLGNVIDPPRSKTLGKFDERVLSGIRRLFTVKTR